MPNNNDYHIYSHIDPTIETLGEFVGEPNSIGIGLDIKKLLLYKDENGNSNLDKLIVLYSPEEYNSNGSGKYNKIIDSLKKEVDSNELVVTTTSNNNIVVENSKTQSPAIYTPKNETKLSSIINVKKGTAASTYLYYTPTPSNLNHLNNLYNDDVKLLFKKFLYRVQDETDYVVVITSSYRSIEQEKKLSKNNKLAKGIELSYHSLRLAIDIKLIPKDPTKPVVGQGDINQQILEVPKWIKTRVINIANSLGLRWGGNFKTTPVDVVHFDAANYFIVNKQEFLKANGITPVQSEPVNSSSNTSDNSKYFDLPLKISTVLAIPLIVIDRVVLTTETNQTVNSVDFECFFAKKLVELLSDKGYKRTFPQIKSNSYKGNVQEIYPHISVWVWSRALSISDISPSFDGSTKYEHVILNITPYIKSLNTSVSDNGGSFNLSLAAITSDIGNKNDDTGKGWKFKDGTQKASPLNKKDYVNQGFLHYIDGDDIKRNRFYFEKSLQANDLIFIRFERLDLEDQRGNLDELETVSINDLPNQTFDMIGLLDNPTITSSYDNASVNVSIAGRDLIKLLIEDGVYFYPTDFTSDGIFSNTGATNSRLDRFGNRGNILDRFQSANKTIDKSLKYLINNLGSIEICPGSLFDGYANTIPNKGSTQTVDSRSRAYPFINLASLNEEQNGKNNDTKEQILEKIDQVRSKNKIKSGSNIQVFNLIKNFLSDRINNGEIDAKSQKIISWETVENKIIFQNKIPDSLDNILLIPDKAWVDSKNRDIRKSLTLSIISNDLEFLYSQIDSEDIDDFDLVKQISYHKTSKLSKDRNYYSEVSVDEIISEMDSSSLGVTNSLLISSVRDNYNLIKSKGKFIFLKLVSKQLKDLKSNEKDIFDDIYNLIINEKGVLDNNNKTNPPLLAGIWQIIKLVIDDSVKDRLLSDSSIGNENGSLLNAIRKICQDPFVEFYTDTYGSQFYFIVRKKPFDRESLLSILEGRVVYEVNNFIENDKTVDSARKGEVQDPNSPLSEKIDTLTINDQSLIIDIEESDILSDTLTTSTEAYSWYKLQLANLTSGSPSDLAFNYLKAVYFNEFADIFGSKPLDLTTSYIPFSPIIDKNSSVSAAYFIKQGIYDLKYMIESHAYLPFTRQGTLIINGDRRIKRGNFIRLKSTDEIFYVDNVSNDFSIQDKSIERATTLSVSRGMVERFIKGVEFNVGEKAYVNSRAKFEPDYNENGFNNNASKSKIINISYFNICDLGIDESIFSAIDENNKNLDYSKSPTASWKVNKEVFNFFLKKLQFSKNDKEILNSGINIFK